MARWVLDPATFHWLLECGERRRPEQRAVALHSCFRA